MKKKIIIIGLVLFGLVAASVLVVFILPKGAEGIEVTARRTACNLADLYGAGHEAGVIWEGNSVESIVGDLVKGRNGSGEFKDKVFRHEVSYPLGSSVYKYLRYNPSTRELEINIQPQVNQ